MGGNSAALALASLMLLVATTSAFNIDTRQPIIRLPPSTDVQPAALFGYTLVLHQTSELQPNTPTNEALSRFRIIVSAPNVSIDSALVKNTGGVYECELGSVNGRACIPLRRTGTERLYDTQGNSGDREEKANQFLGGSMASYKAGLIVCAHRYTTRRGAFFLTPTGRCFATTNRDLTGFETFEPCPAPGSENLNTASAGVCQTGTSSVITENLGQYVFGMGAPGFSSWRGRVIRHRDNTFFRQQPGASSPYGYQGYAMVAGNFRSTGREDYAVSVPRANTYRGKVNIINNDDNLNVVSQPDLQGEQMGEYYGFSLLSADLNGDGLDELLVGAPMYRANSTEPETGRVYLYSNIQGSLRRVRTIEGFRAFTRFGHAMANLGDINGDSYDDVAISAPFSNANESGTVYIFHSSSISSQLLSINPQQVIVGSNLSLPSSDLEGLRGFGTVLASGVDVDANTYNDLAVGSFLSQQVFLLRTRPLAEITTSLDSDSLIVMLEIPTCQFDGSTRLPCFNLTACATYRGNGLNPQLNLTYNINADVAVPERRVVFSDGSTTLNIPVTTNRNQRDCVMRTAYVLSTINDRFNPFTMEFSVTVQEGNIPTGDGNPNPPFDFSTVPIVTRSGVGSIQIETFKNCSGVICVPELQIPPGEVRYTANNMDGTMTESSRSITTGKVRSITVRTNVYNRGEDAFQATLTVTAPSRHLEIGRLFGSLNSGAQFSLNCPLRDETGGVARVMCSIGNPLSGGGNILISTTFNAREGLVGNEGDLSIAFNVSSVNPGMGMGMNSYTGQLSVNAAADITMDSMGLVSPEIISYSDLTSNEIIQNVTQLGPAVITSFVVRNSGPSTVGNVSLTINWPFNSTNVTRAFILYPAQITTSGTGATVVCQNSMINPNNYNLPSLQVDEEGGGINITESRRRRKRRSVVPYFKGKTLRKRQMTSTTGDAQTVNRTISCGTTALTCVPIRCNILGLQGMSNAQARVNIIGFLDERFFNNSVDRFVIIPTAEVRIVNGDFISQQIPNSGKTSSANIRVIPASSVVTVERPVNVLAWWVIFLAIVGAIIIIAAIFAILWGLGFFKRRKHEELKQRKEELQNLEENGKGPSNAEGGSTENMLSDGTNL